MRTWSFTLTRKDPARPWIVLEMGRHQVELSDDVSFGEWRGDRWPAPEWELQLDPGLEMQWVEDGIRTERPR